MNNRHLVQEIIPVHDIAVRIRVPDGSRVTSVYTAPDRTELRYDHDGDYISATVPRVDIHKMVVVELSDAANSRQHDDIEQRAWFTSCWRRWLLEFNVRDEPPYLTRLDATVLADAAAEANIDWFWVHAMDNGGTLFHATEIGHKHSALQNRDFLEELTRALSERGIRWGFHVNMTKNQWMYRLRPEWRQKWQDGTDRGASDVNPDWDNLCPNSPHREYDLALLRELSEKFHPEGFWVDRLDWGGVLPERFSCACRYCTAQFEDETGHSFPDKVDWTSSGWHAFVEWRARSLTRFLAEIRDTVKAIDPSITVCLSTHNGLDMFGYWFHGQDVEEITEPADHVTQELHAEREGYLAYSLHPRFTRATSGGKPMDGITFRHSGDLDFAFKPHPQLEAEAFTVMANGASAMFEDLIYPQGSIEPHTYTWMRPIFDKIESCQPWLGGEPVPFAAVYFSKSTRLYYGRDDPGERYLLNFLGACKALLETHIPFEIVTDRGLTTESLQRFPVVVLPNAACLDVAHLRALVQYVEDGGSLVSTYKTSLFDIRGTARRDFGLAELFGAQFREQAHLPLSYVRFEREGVLSQGLPEETPLLHRRSHLKVEAAQTSETEGRLTLAQEGMNRLSAACHPPSPTASPYPAAVLKAHGKGRSVYFPGQPDAVYLRWGHPEFKTLLANAVRWAAASPPPLEVHAPMSVEATLLEQPGSARLVAHLVNYQPELGRTWDLVRGRFLA